MTQIWLLLNVGDRRQVVSCWFPSTTKRGALVGDPFKTAHPRGQTPHNTKPPGFQGGPWASERPRRPEDKSGEKACAGAPIARFFFFSARPTEILRPPSLGLKSSESGGNTGKYRDANLPKAEGNRKTVGLPSSLLFLTPQVGFCQTIFTIVSGASLDMTVFVSVFFVFLTAYEPGSSTLFLVDGKSSDCFCVDLPSCPIPHPALGCGMTCPASLAPDFTKHPSTNWGLTV